MRSDVSDDEPMTPDLASAAYERIGVTRDISSPEALRRAEPLLIQRAGVYERMGSKMWELAWADSIETGHTLPAMGEIDHAEPAFVDYVESVLSPSDRPITCLVPGCGKGLAVAHLAQSLPNSMSVGLDIAPAAVATARDFLQRQLGGKSNSKSRRWAMEVGDFFDWHAPFSFDMIYDATFLCSLPPTRRSDWARRMAELLARDGELVTLIFPCGEYQGGPPFAMDPQLVRTLLEHNGFRCVSMEEVPRNKRSRPGFRGCTEWFARWRLDAAEPAADFSPEDDAADISMF